MYPVQGADGQRVLSRPITFCVTNACQLRCDYCYEQHKGDEYMDFEVARKFIDLILSGDKGMSEYVNLDISPAVMLEFIGGEPFLAIDLMDQICDYWIDRCIELRHPWATRYMISVCSNGVAYFDPRVQGFLARHKDHLSFSVTIDGTKEMHDACRVFTGTRRGSYDIAVAAARDWMERGGYMGSKVTIAPNNLSHLYDSIMHMLGLGYAEINANVVYEEGWTIEHAAEYYTQIKRIGQHLLDSHINMDDVYIALFEEDFFRPKNPSDLENWCGGNGVMIACDWDGRIYPCIRYMEMSLGNTQPPMVLGNVNDGILQCAEHRTCFDCLRKIDRRTQSTDECFSCPIAEGCSWCTAYNYQVFGTPDARATYICPMHKARALANAWFWPRYYAMCGSDTPYTLHVPDEWALEIISPKELSEIKENCS